MKALSLPLFYKWHIEFSKLLATKFNKIIFKMHSRGIITCYIGLLSPYSNFIGLSRPRLTGSNSNKPKPKLTTYSLCNLDIPVLYNHYQGRLAYTNTLYSCIGLPAHAHECHRHRPRLNDCRHSRDRLKPIHEVKYSCLKPRSKNHNYENIKSTLIDVQDVVRPSLTQMHIFDRVRPTKKYEVHPDSQNCFFDLNEFKSLWTEEHSKRLSTLDDIQMNQTVMTDAFRIGINTNSSPNSYNLIPETNLVNNQLYLSINMNAVTNNSRLAISSNLFSSNNSNIQNCNSLCSSDVTLTKDKPDKVEDENPSGEQLTKVYNTLSKELPFFFRTPMTYNIYSKDIIFENRIKGTKTVGLFSYIRQQMFLRSVGHIKYAYVQFEILKITQHPEENTVKVRWRIVGVPTLRSLLMVLNMKAFSKEVMKEKLDYWYDGFSTFYVGKDGLVYKHIADKMMPDEELLFQKKPSLYTRLAAMLGLAPKSPVASETAVTSSVIDVTKKKAELDTNKSLIYNVLH